MDLKTHIMDTIKEWQMKIGYREGNMKLYYPGESLALLLGVGGENGECETADFNTVLQEFCRNCESELGQIAVDGDWQRYCLTIPAKGCTYVAKQVPEPEFLKRFLAVITKPGNSMEEIKKCFADYAKENNTVWKEDRVEHGHNHGGAAFYFEDATVDEYVYRVEENEFGLSYHRFTRDEYMGFFS